MQITHVHILTLTVVLFLMICILYSKLKAQEHYPVYGRRYWRPRRFWGPRRRWIYGRPPGWYYRRYYDGGPWFYPYY
jgi:hypothetical protein